MHRCLRLGVAAWCQDVCVEHGWEVLGPQVAMTAKDQTFNFEIDLGELGTNIPLATKMDRHSPSPGPGPDGHDLVPASHAPCEASRITSLVSAMGLKEIKSLVQGHPAGDWRSLRVCLHLMALPPGP